MANELRFVDGDLLFVGDDLAMSEDCCCGEAAEQCPQCTSFTSATTFTLEVAGFGTYTLVWTPGSAPITCRWLYNIGSGNTCGTIYTAAFEYRSGTGWVLYISPGRNSGFTPGTYSLTGGTLNSVCGAGVGDSSYHTLNRIIGLSGCGSDPATIDIGLTRAS